MRRLPAVIGRLPVVLLSACMASHTVERTAEQMTVRPAVDRLLTQGQLQLAEARLHDLGCDSGPVDGVYTAQTQAPVRAYQGRYGLPVSGVLDYITHLQLIPGLDFDKDEP
jgi:peptidoglycan hydrolase-like protein with peptidoglycan-binding domain